MEPDKNYPLGLLSLAQPKAFVRLVKDNGDRRKCSGKRSPVSFVFQKMTDVQFSNVVAEAAKISDY